MNNEPLRMGLFDPPKLDLAQPLKAANPMAYFILKHWKILTILFLLVVIGGMGFGGWKYYGHVTEKIAKIEQQAKEYKEQASNLRNNINKLSNDMQDAKKQREKFDQDIAELRSEAITLRRRIAGLSGKIPEGTKPEDAQITINDIRLDIKNRWETIGSKEAAK